MLLPQFLQIMVQWIAFTDKFFFELLFLTWWRLLSLNAWMLSVKSSRKLKRKNRTTNYNYNLRSKIKNGIASYKLQFAENRSFIAAQFILEKILQDIIYIFSWNYRLIASSLQLVHIPWGDGRTTENRACLKYRRPCTYLWDYREPARSVLLSLSCNWSK